MVVDSSGSDNIVSTRPVSPGPAGNWQHYSLFRLNLPLSPIAARHIFPEPRWPFWTRHSAVASQLTEAHPQGAAVVPAMQQMPACRILDGI